MICYLSCGGVTETLVAKVPSAEPRVSASVFSHFRLYQPIFLPLFTYRVMMKTYSGMFHMRLAPRNRTVHQQADAASSSAPRWFSGYVTGPLTGRSHVGSRLRRSRFDGSEMVESRVLGDARARSMIPDGRHFRSHPLRCNPMFFFLDVKLQILCS